VRIVSVGGSGAFKRRLLEMGFLPGVDVAVKKYAPLRDPIESFVKKLSRLRPPAPTPISSPWNP